VLSLLTSASEGSEKQAKTQAKITLAHLLAAETKDVKRMRKDASVASVIRNRIVFFTPQSSDASFSIEALHLRVRITLDRMQHRLEVRLSFDVIERTVT